MNFQALPLAGAWRISIEPVRDARGWFGRRFSPAPFAERGLPTEFSERSVSHNLRRGTLRGLHYQRPPHGECKLVRCTRGAIFDVLADLRADSATFGRWHGEVLRAGDGATLYIPAGFAHGFLTLEDQSDVDYEIHGPYVPAAAAGIRFDDPRLAIRWPEAAQIISERDRTLPYLGDA